MKFRVYNTLTKLLMSPKLEQINDFKRFISVENPTRCKWESV